MKFRTKLLIIVGLAFLFTVGRFVMFNSGSVYAPPEIATIDPEAIAPHLYDYRPFEDSPEPAQGHVVIDLTHANNLDINDLSPLRDRLAARRVTLETLKEGAEETLTSQLRQATALLVVAPTVPYAPAEQKAIVEFVEDGGRLLLVADPTRPVVEDEEEDLFSLYSIFFPTSAVPAINSLAQRFGVVYFDDYLYNLEDNAGNYRNVKLTPTEGNSLNRGVETVVFFASHSIRGEGHALLTGGPHTHSPMRTGETSLTAALLTMDERVLALGDLTFLTAPYHTVADNDRFLSQIADWLAVAGRIRDHLEDFPYLFGRPVDMVQVSGDLLDPRLIARSSELQMLFDHAHLTLDLRAEPAPEHDALLVGTFEDLALVDDYLTQAGITVTLTLTKPESLSDDAEPEAADGVTPVPPEPTPVEEDLDEEEELEEPVVGEMPEEEETPESTESEEEAEPSSEEEKEEEELHGTLEIASLGTVATEGTTLFLVIREGERTVLLVLAKDGEQVMAALERLSRGDFEGCVQNTEITLCSSDDAQTGGFDSEDDEEVEDASDTSAAGVFIMANDTGLEGERTSASELKAALSESYAVTVWSIQDAGLPDDEDLEGYDVYIIDSGDYALDEENTEVFSTLDNVEVSKMLLIGAQPLPVYEGEFEPIYDLQVMDAEHPLANGFDVGDVIPLGESESGVPAIVIPDAEDSDIGVIFARGPESTPEEAPAVMTILDEYDEEESSRAVVATFAFYRLPEDAQRTLALNIVHWLMGGE